MKCWSCGASIEKRLVLRDSLIRGRDLRQGGPYRLYRCPQCLAESKIESTPRGRFYASPEKEIAAVEYLFCWSAALTPEDFLRIAEWHERHGASRRAFFERDGDSRYSRGSLGALLRRIYGWFTKRGRDEGDAPRAAAAAGGAGAAGNSGAAGATGAARPETGAILHPYRILGLEPGAKEDDLRRAFHDLVRRWHPDKLEGESPELLAEASRRLQELVEAYERLLAKMRK
ncbi:MAG: J domain-containing protein [Planctomycetes bacterium]|nr:J domain-containing protein [Planctomycetota bacterium]